MKLGEQVTVLEREFKDLMSQWDRFFCGDIRLPPVKEREHLRRRLRMLTERPGVARRADSFRLEQLQHRFMTYSQNWERMLREREEGRSRSTIPTRGSRLTAKPTPKPNARPSAPVESDSATNLFERYEKAKSSLGQDMNMDRAAFDEKIAAQRKAIEARLGSAVRFDVLVEDGRVKLAAKKAKKS